MTTQMNAEISAMADKLEALGSPVRLQIVRELVRVGEQGLPVSALQDRLDVAASTLSHHLRKLMSVDLVRQERQGTTLLCRAQFESIRDLAGFLLSECCVEETSGSGAK